MGPAVLGLVGVVLGALLSGSGAYLMARRKDSQQARAAARLLESDLRMTSGNLRLLVAALRVPDNYADLRSFLRLPPQHRWSEHQAILAATLGSTEWYAVAEAYESLDLLRAASSRNELFVEDGRRVFHTVITEWFEELATKVQSGADALSRLAGGAPVRPPEGMTVRDAITSLVQDPGEAPSVHEADKPASQ